MIHSSPPMVVMILGLAPPLVPPRRYNSSSLLEYSVFNSFWHCSESSSRSIWLCFSSISNLEHYSTLFGLQIPLLLAACTLLDIPSRWNPRAKQSHTMALFAVLRTAALFKSRAETKKNQYTNVYWFFLVGAAGFEPTASSSRTRRATNCAMPRKYRSQLRLRFSWLGMRESNSHK